MTPTEEQLAIIDKAVNSTESLLINALAGAAKTTTLELICKALPANSPILSLAFNKRIAEEMAKRLPMNVKAQTLNSVGHRVWMQACSKKIFLNTKKSYELMKALVDDLKRTDKEEAYETFSETLKMVSQAKHAGYIPDKWTAGGKRLVGLDFFDRFEEEPTEQQRYLVDSCLFMSIQQAYSGHIDFDDQIYMPTLFGGTFPRFPLVMVDEAQDLSGINHAMLERLVTSRLIAVGDPWQSIYGFRGAVSSGMSRLRERFSMTEMGLSISFRCPKSVVANAHFRVPHMKYPEWAKEGTVRSLEEWGSKDIPDNSAIICRNNAPLFSLALELIRSGRGVQLVGSDLGPGLIKVLKKLGPETLTRKETHVAITAWETERFAKSRSAGATKDRAECLRVFADFGETLGGAIAYAEHLFRSAGPIQLLSGHKSKGLEWDTVFHLDPWRIPSPYATGEEQQEQELNVRYVIETRAKDTLNFVSMETFSA